MCCSGWALLSLAPAIGKGPSCQHLSPGHASLTGNGKFDFYHSFRSWQRAGPQYLGPTDISIECSACNYLYCLFRSSRGRALQRKLCILFARAMSEITFMSSPARAEGDERPEQQGSSLRPCFSLGRIPADHRNQRTFCIDYSADTCQSLTHCGLSRPTSRGSRKL